MSSPVFSECSTPRESCPSPLPKSIQHIVNFRDDFDWYFDHLMSGNDGNRIELLDGFKELVDNLSTGISLAKESSTSESRPLGFPQQTDPLHPVTISPKQRAPRVQYSPSTSESHREGDWVTSFTSGSSQTKQKGTGAMEGPELSSTRPDLDKLCSQHKTRGKKFIVGGVYDHTKCLGWCAEDKKKGLPERQCSRTPK